MGIATQKHRRNGAAQSVIHPTFFSLAGAQLLRFVNLAKYGYESKFTITGID
jgi:hypothetical protein